MTTQRLPGTAAAAGCWGGVGSELGLGLTASWRVRKCFENNFSKVLDDTAKADQNLASLLLTKRFGNEQIGGGEESKSLSIAKRNFQKYLTTSKKAD